jgi:hypothetical protein
MRTQHLSSLLSSRALALALALASIALPTAAPAQAQDAPAHPRRARAMTLFGAPVVAVMVGPDRAWLPGAEQQPLAICHGERCRPVRAVEACAPPQCPGQGVLAIATERVADVGDYPTGRDDFHREREAMVADAELGTISHTFAPHPSPAPRPPRWRRATHSSPEVAWELSIAAGPAILAHTGIATGDLVVGGGVRLSLDHGSSDGDILSILLGNFLGLDLRAHVLPGIRGQVADDFGIAVGIAPIAMAALEDETVRWPSFWGLFVPEIGWVLRDGDDAAIYVAWNAPFSVLVDEHAALEVRATAIVIDDWVDGDAVEALLSVTAAIVLR